MRVNKNTYNRNIYFIKFLVKLFQSENNDTILKNKILKNIRCLICQGQSVYDSQSQNLQISMKLVVEKKINDGFQLKMKFMSF